MILRNIYQRRIVRLLRDSGRPLTTKQISMFLNMHWSTVRKHLWSLNQKGYVFYRTYGNKIYWSTSKERMRNFLR